MKFRVCSGPISLLAVLLMLGAGACKNFSGTTPKADSGTANDGAADKALDSGHAGAAGPGGTTGDGSGGGVGSGGAGVGGSGGDDNGSGGAGGGAAGAALGAPCGAARDCASNFCVDGVCCESACNGACEACGEVDAKGMCVLVTGKPRTGHSACAGAVAECAGTCDGASRKTCTYPGAAQSCRAASCTNAKATLAASCDGKGACPAAETVDCAPNMCAGAICGGGCSEAQPCTGTTFCSAGKCVPKKAAGQACQTGAECAAGTCADGYCCNTACTGACMACNLTGLLGTCSPVKSAADESCTGMQMCDATGMCKKTPGQTCTAAGECSSGNCVDGRCCGVASCGACQACTGGGGTCVAVTGAEDADSCSGTKSCDATGGCKTKVGQACTAGTQCASGFCADGVCCNSACTGPCESCGETASKGTCTAVSGAPRTGHTACAGAGSPCGGMCDGTNRTACAYPAATVSCRAANCTSGTATLGATCDGKGACPAVMTVNCSPNTCSGTACAGGCSSTQPCSATTYCSGGTCVAKKANGAACGAGGNAECTSNACVDGFCCGMPSCGTCQACTGTGGTCVAVKSADDADSCMGTSGCDATGACKKKTGQACSAGTECVTGNCPQSVCCNVACTGQCESCAESTSKGTCVAVTGAPASGKTACTGTGTTCGGTCDGTNRTACSYKGSTVSCHAPTCSGGMATSETFCNGAGACPAFTTTQCGAYACNGTACRSGSCSSQAQCASNAICNGTCMNCGANLTACSNTCVDTRSTASACGDCNTSCVATSRPSCVSGSCVCKVKDPNNSLTNPGLDVTASPWVLVATSMGTATYETATDYDGCVGSGSIKTGSTSQSFHLCTDAVAGRDYAFGFAFKGMSQGDQGVCRVEFSSSSSCATTIGANFEATTASAPNATTWIAGNGLATAPTGTTKALFTCASPFGLGYYDRMYFRLQTSPGGF